MFLLLVFIAGFGCVLPVGVVDLKGVTFVTNYFGRNVQKTLISEEGNIFFSPLSLSTLLSMLYLAARGESKKEIGELGYRVLEDFNVNIPASYKKVFGILQNSSEGYRLEFANALLTQVNNPILEKYKSTLIRYYDAVLREVDFAGEKVQALEDINRWVNQKTRGMITNLIDDLDDDTLLVLLNAVYFKGRWKDEFEPEMTRDLPFYNNGGIIPKSVPTMKIRSEFLYANYSHKRLEAISLPYVEGRMRMIILLPFERDGVKRMESEISPIVFDKILASFEETETVVSLPKFKMQSFFRLKEHLESMGVKTIFGNGADFSGIVRGGGIHVSDIIHKAAIEVNEEGSQASSVSGGFINSRRLPHRETIRKFTVDHPFVFYIVDNRTNAILFIGRVNEL